MSAKRTKAPCSQKQAKPVPVEIIWLPGPTETIEPPVQFTRVLDQEWRPLMDALAWMNCKDQLAVDSLARTPGAAFRFDVLFWGLGNMREPAEAWTQLEPLVTEGRVAMRGRWVMRKQIVADGLLCWVETADDLIGVIKPIAVRNSALRDDVETPKGQFILMPGSLHGRHLTEVEVRWADLVAATTERVSPATSEAGTNAPVQFDPALEAAPIQVESVEPAAMVPVPQAEVEAPAGVRGDKAKLEAAHAALFPEGSKHLRPGERRKKMAAYLKENGEVVPNDKTFKRHGL